MERVIKMVNIRTYETVRWLRMDLMMLAVFVLLVQLGSNVIAGNPRNAYFYEGNSRTYRSALEVHAGGMAEHVHTWKMTGYKSAEDTAVKATAAKAEVTKVMTTTKAVKEEPAAEHMIFTENEPAGKATGTVAEQPVTKENTSPEYITDNTVENTGSDMVTGRTTEEEMPQSEEMTGVEMLELDGFVINENGVIESCKDPAFVAEGGIIVFPADERCSGIGSDALTGITSVEDIYIPANITFIAPGALERLEGLMYIEVAPDNPVYESRDGILYSKSGELITVPSGRE